MIMNSDERQTDLDGRRLEQLYVQLLTELERYPDIDWSRGIPAGTVPYMKGDKSFQCAHS
jgi:hypothetical protein